LTSLIDVLELGELDPPGVYFQYDSDLKINPLSMDNIRQIGKQIIDMCTSTECHVYRYARQFSFQARRRKIGKCQQNQGFCIYI
jgi:hypothetical protein